MSAPEAAGRRFGLPIWAQIAGLLVGSLVVAQVTTLALAFALPLPPPPHYDLREIAAALKDGPLALTGRPPLQRAYQSRAPATQSAGWQTSEPSRLELAHLLGADPADVRLLFYSPPPFVEPRLGPGVHPFSTASTAMGGARAWPHGGRVVEASLFGSLLLAPAGAPGGLTPVGPAPPMGGITSAGAITPAGGIPGGGGGAGPGPGDFGGLRPGGPFSGRGAGSGGRGGRRGHAGDDASGGSAHTLDPPVTPVVVGAPDGPLAPGARFPGGPGPIDGPIQTAPRPVQGEAGPWPPAPVNTPPPGDLDAQIGARPPPPPPRPVERAPPPQPSAPLPVVPAVATPAPRPTRAPTAASDIPPAQALPLPAPESHVLFGLDRASTVGGAFVAALRTGPGRWETIQPSRAAMLSRWRQRIALWFLLSFTIVAPLGYLLARRLTAPLDRLADAADRLGRDPSVTIPRGGGSLEIDRVAAAFDSMQARLRRYVDDRTAMVGAISHDLRTPLARMRFRLEKAPEALRLNMLGDLGQMEEMISAVLAFIRDASEPGLRERVDLRSIVECVVDDAAMVGGDAVLAPGDAVPVEVDIMSVQRMLTNLVENALRYGDQARVHLFSEGEEAVARIVDAGPGLSEPELERVFAPFYRSSESRTLNQGGIGLGLSVSRSIARAHGGDVVLRRAPDGFLAEVRLPLAPAYLQPLRLPAKSGDGAGKAPNRTVKA